MKKYWMILLIICTVTGCEKQLEEKSDKTQFKPEKLNDVQSMLDYYIYTGYDTGLGETSADNYFVSDDTYNGFYYNSDRTAYNWGTTDVTFPGPYGEWGIVYGKIYYANVAMEALDAINKNAGNETDWNDLYGQALFKRGQGLWRLADVFALPYKSEDAETMLGLPIRLNTNYEERSVRSSLADTYRQIITDLKASIALLKITPLHPVRPSKPAAYGMLSVVYLSMREYPLAKLYADSALQLRPQLIDYNTVDADPSVRYSFENNNVESLYMSLVNNNPLLISTARIDTTLYNSYAANDLRKLIYFRPRPDGFYSFKGSYAGFDGLFSGIATDELYLNRAECNARAGQTAAALDDLNKLLLNRYATGTFVPVTATDAADALRKILIERRKELVYRFSRWTDIRRLNLEGEGILPMRKINGQIYQLPVNSSRYARPIPQDIIDITGMQQNPQ